jgi:hypothetical protein
MLDNNPNLTKKSGDGGRPHTTDVAAATRPINKLGFLYADTRKAERRRAMEMEYTVM